MQNQQSASSSKAMYIIIGLVIIVGAAYYLYSKGNTASTAAISTGGSNSLTTSAAPGTTDGSGNPAVGADILPLLKQLESLKIDSGFFTGSSTVSVAYRSLVDFGETIPPLDVGRQNPFAPVGGGAQPPAAPAVQIKR